MSAQVKGSLQGTVLGLVLVGLAYLFYLAFFDFREPPMTVNYTHPVVLASPAKNRTEIVELSAVRAGGVMYTYREYCITALYYVLRNERWLVPDDPAQRHIGLPLLPTRARRALGCEVQSFDTEIPKSTPPGEYTFVARWVYTIKGNPVAQYGLEWPPIRVRVVK